jgi:chitodextrinase
MLHLTTLWRTPRPRLLLLAATLAVLAAAGAGPGLDRGGPPAAAAATAPCGSMAGQPADIKHIVIIMDENQSYNAIMGGTAAPNIKNYASQCGVATKYWAITHPSHSDYIATVAGNTYVPPGCSDWTCVSKPLNFCGGSTGTNGSETCPNIFSQMDTAGKSWKVYGESMPSNCYASASGQYSAGHNPPVWFIQGTGSWNINASCKANDVPLESSTADITNNSLPAYSWIVPNKCNDMHNCSSGSPVTAGDNFIKTWVDRIIATPDYQNGNTIVFITWDEGVEGGRPFNEDCLSGSGLTDESFHVPLIVLSPYIQAGSKPGAFYTHYGLLKATERLLGITTYLGHAGDANVGDLLAGFGIQLGGGGGGGGDTTPPDAPTGLTAASTGQTSVHLTWNAATDNVGVTNYRIYRNGTAVATIGNTLSYDDTGLQAGTTYSYTVHARDAAGNESGDSNTASATTDPGGGGGGSTVFTDDFETGNLSKWTTVKGLTVQTHDAFAGSFGAEDKTTGTTQYASSTFAGQTDLTFEMRFKVLSKVTTTIELAKLKNSSGATVADLLLTGSTNKLRLRNGVAATTLTASQTAPAGSWHLISVHVTIGGTSGHTDVTYDGNPVSTFTQTWNTGTSPITQLWLGDTSSGRTSDVVFDNVVAHT